MSTLNNTTVNGVITQTMAASQPNHCVRLGEAQALMASLFQGVWNNATTYTAGQMATDTPAGGSVSLYTANQTTLNQQPSLNPSVWRLAAAGGGAGASAYVYVAYASDNLGTGFSLTPASGLGYIAFLTSSTAIATPTAANFTGLWQLYAGPAGTNGTNGTNAYLYVAYASNTSGAGFSLTPGSGLNYVAFLPTTTPIATLAASNFAGLWQNYVGTAGTNGTNGTNGANAYVYVAYASDASGTGFSLTPGSGLNFIAWLNSTTAITTPTASNFTGLWRLFVGANGTNGTNGTNAYLYVAYASDNLGTGFSLTPGSGLNFIAFLTSTIAISSPTSSNFTGLWQQYVGAAGATGATGAAGAAGASAYLYIAFASDTAGDSFSLTPGAGLNYVAFLSSNTVISSPSAANFAGLWKQYANPFTVTAPLTLSAGVLAINASSTNTGNYVVQRDSSGNFAGNVITANSVVVGSGTLAFMAGALTVNTSVAIGGTLSISGLSGVLQATGGAVTGGATSNAVTEDPGVNVATPTGNAYFTRARVLATPLLGYATTNPSPTLLATDTILSALGKLDAKTGNYASLAGAAFTGAVSITQPVVASGSPNILALTGAANTTLAGGVEASDVVFNFARNVQFNAGALALQRAMSVTAPTYAFTGGTTVAIAATVGISGAPVAGTNATVTTAAALKIAGGAVGGGTVSAYGLYVDAPTGAANNYAAAFNTGDVLVNAGWLRCAAAYGLKVNGAQVVTNRQTGWTAATGTATRTSFATASVTLPNLAQAVKALIDDLITHGLIGT